jgi:hypothetical protein
MKLLAIYELYNLGSGVFQNFRKKNWRRIHIFSADPLFIPRVFCRDPDDSRYIILARLKQMSHCIPKFSPNPKICSTVQYLHSKQPFSVLVHKCTYAHDVCIYLHIFKRSWECTDIT